MDASDTNSFFDKAFEEISLSSVLCIKKSAMLFSEGVKLSYKDSI